MSCSGGLWACAAGGNPLPQGVSNNQGFFGPGVPGCCKLPCPTLPAHKIVICVRVNSCTSVALQQGCVLPTVPGGPACEIDYSWPITEDSWGRKCRVVRFIRTLPGNTAVRLRFCSYGCGMCPSGPCDLTYGGAPINNALLKFTVDGYDITNTIASWIPDAPVEGAPGYPCSHVSCFGGGATSSCCAVSGQSGANLYTLANLPSQTEIVVQGFW